MRLDGVGFGSRISSAPSKLGFRRTNAENGDGLCQTQPGVERLEAFPSNPRFGIRRGAASYRCTGGEIAETQRIQARTEIVKRAEANPAEIARAPRGPDIASALSPSGKTGENGLEKTAPTRTRTPPLRYLKRISGMVRAASRDCARPGTNAT